MGAVGYMADEDVAMEGGMLPIDSSFVPCARIADSTFTRSRVPVHSLSCLKAVQFGYDAWARFQRGKVTGGT